MGTLPIVITDTGEKGAIRETIKEQTPSLEFNRKYEVLEEHMRAIEGTNMFGSVDAFDLCLVPNVVLPPEFKVLDFEKFNGSRCPLTHLRMYFHKMVAYSNNDKLLIHCFQDSLTRATIRWYIQLASKDLHLEGSSSGFYSLVQAYYRNGPRQVDLAKYEKENKQTFKEYAYCWREVAVQVHPLVEDREAISLFVNTLKDPLF
ncbi:uncharacterized protein LOC131156132 [Malania oleifera]|uniref:uncharacterized protein LOC131156132 n=1 Tax=Malania oleifera TaxID=397392 RepID=UPI0025AE461D|nr:uncharacterized protein LOC131156132 [Malania oleifera]